MAPWTPKATELTVEISRPQQAPTPSVQPMAMGHKGIRMKLGETFFCDKKNMQPMLWEMFIIHVTIRVFAMEPMIYPSHTEPPGKQWIHRHPNPRLIRNLGATFFSEKTSPRFFRFVGLFVTWAESPLFLVKICPFKLPSPGVWKLRL